MAGFLDTLFGSPEQTMALGLLGANLMAGQGPQGFLAAQQHLAGADERKLRRGLLEAQIDETRAQADERKQNAAARAKRMADVGGWLAQLDNAVPQANQAVIGQTGNLAPTVANAGLQTRALGQLQADNPLFGIPRQAIMGDMALNEGKNIPEWMFKRGTPDMQNINGVWVDKNRAQPGQSIPQMSPTGQGYQLLADASVPGGYRVTTPVGAMDTYRGFKEADADIASRYALEKVYNPATKREEFVSRSRVLGPQQPEPLRQQPPTAGQVAAEPGMRGDFVGDPAQVMEAISQIKNPQERANAMAAFQEQARRTGGFAEGGGFAAGPSAGEAASAAGAKAEAEAAGRLSAERSNEKAKRTDKAGDMVEMLGRAKLLLERGDPTASGAGALVDKTAAWFGTTTKSAQTASALENIASALTMNVPRMEGPQGVLDVQLYMTSAGRVGDRTLPVKERLAALEQVETLQKKYAGQPMETPRSQPTAATSPGAFPDPGKEQRYQEWKRRQGK